MVGVLLSTARKLALKIASYGVMHLVVAILVAFAITRDWRIALAVGMVEPFFHRLFDPRPGLAPGRTPPHGLQHRRGGRGLHRPARHHVAGRTDPRPRPPWPQPRPAPLAETGGGQDRDLWRHAFRCRRGRGLRPDPGHPHSPGHRHHRTPGPDGLLHRPRPHLVAHRTAPRRPAAGDGLSLGGADSAAYRLFNATRNTSALSFRLEAGLTYLTVSNSSRSRARTPPASPPWKFLDTKFPPGRRVRMAKSAAISIRAMIFRWSVWRWPTVLCAISDSTRSGAPPMASISC